jgi:hypothetical protein
VNVHSQNFKFTVFVKRGNKLFTNQSTIDQYTKTSLQRTKYKYTDCPKPKTTKADFTNQYKSKGNRTGLNITPETMSLIKELRKLGIQYKYAEKDFTHD